MATASAEAQAISRTVARYVGTRPADRHYVDIKLRTDPLTKELIRQDAHWGDLVDAGCGRGQFGLLLFELGRVRSLCGYDWDANKIATAAAAAGSVGKYRVADFRTAPPLSADTILLFDVLQYLSVEEQRSLLGSLAGTLRPGGRLLLRTPDRSHGWQARFSQWLERMGKALGVNRSHTLVFRSSEELRGDLESLGFVVTQAEHGRSSLLDNRMFVAERVG